ncbi:hypothetical protein [Streptodolium elevatio]|uniref:Uncharacterized protein n=1 Tax=Streptodolium elevatio TaxID=3157996 RepID=A0ABV3DUX0_9ACTN
MDRSTRLVFAALGLAVAMLFAVAVGTAAGYLARRDGASMPSALTRASTAFAAALTLQAVLAATMTAWLT